MWRQPGAPVLGDLLRASEISISVKWSCEVHSGLPKILYWVGSGGWARGVYFRNSHSSSADANSSGHAYMARGPICQPRIWGCMQKGAVLEPMGAPFL